MRWVLWPFKTVGLCYFLDFDDIELCVLEGLTQREGYSLWRTCGPTRSLSGNFHALPEWHCLCVWDGELPALGWAAAHLAFPLIWQTTPIFNSHVTPQHLPFPVFSHPPFPQALLPPCTPGLLWFASVPIHISYTHSPSLKPEKPFFSASHITFHYHNILSQFWTGGGGEAISLYTHQMNKAQR